MTDEIISNDYFCDIQDLHMQEKDTADREDGSMHRRHASPDEFGSQAGLVDAISDDGTFPSPVKEEDCVFTGFPDMPMPTIHNPGRRFSLSDADLDIADFGAGQYIVEEGGSPAARENVTRWLDTLPEADTAREEAMTESPQSYSGSSEGPAVFVSYNEVNVALAKRNLSAFRELPERPWELRRPSEVQAEVQAEAQRRRLSQSSWGSHEGPEDRLNRLRRVDFALLEELKSFSFTTRRRGRCLTRPDFPPMSPRAVACKLWPELPDFTVPLEQEDIYHEHA
ncbi:MAG: hypothetical protein L6R39_007105 [Caloplaca ligustica]|nr:MAG: hypothetical protein L6R39_007105 [Caloplaca ligustica]